eukprot:SAG31_NODE_13091_length_893_cov_1.343829_2_plen_160_part_00
MIDGVIELIKYMEWEKITILAIDSEFGLAGAGLMRKRIAEMGPNSRLEVVASYMYNEANVEAVMDDIYEDEYRLIFLHTTVADAERVITIAHEKKMMGHAGWAWIGSDWAQSTLFDEFSGGDDALLEEMKDGGVEGLVALRPREEITATTTHVKHDLIR